MSSEARKRKRRSPSALWELERDVAPNGMSKSECLTPRSKERAATIAAWSSELLTYVCPVCRHVVTSPARNVVRSWCLFCADRALCGSEHCDVCVSKSLARSTIRTPSGKFSVVECWSPSNALPAHAVFGKSMVAGEFVCRDGCGSTFRMRVDSVSRGSWCPCSRRKSETRLFHWLVEKGLDVLREWGPHWCATPYVTWVRGKIRHGRYQYRFDFAVRVRGSVFAVVELDGEQHYRQVSNWASPLANQVRDAYKSRLATRRGIPVVRVKRENLDAWTTSDAAAAFLESVAC